MNTRRFDVTAIGNAIVDVIAQAEDSLLAQHNLPKGAMNLIDAATAEKLYAVMGPGKEASGGSAGNTIAGIAALGGKTAYIGKVAADQLGEVFTHDIRAVGVTYDTKPLVGGLPTARSLIFVTPDAQRTMNTCPGASHELAPQRLDEQMIRSASITFLEGYLWGPERPRHAMLRAAQIAHEAGRTVAFTLSESLCIPGRKEGVLGMIDGGMVDVLFANEDEAMLLAGAGDLDGALAKLSPLVATLVVTRGPAGAMAIEGGSRVEISAAPVERVVDTTGAGDLFAAGFLAARCRARPLERCLEAGAQAAAEVISHFGARPEANLRELVQL